MRTKLTNWKNQAQLKTSLSRQRKRSATNSTPAKSLDSGLPLTKTAVQRGSSSVSTEISPEAEATTALSLYLREIGQVDLLTLAQENALGRRIKRGDAKARDQMIKANLRLVVHIARDYEHCGLPLLDLINEGNIGLMKAAERFDPAKGAKFSTYASLWIKQAIRRGLAGQAKTIRLPVNAVDTLYRLRHTAVRLSEELGRDPSDEELAQELGISTRRVTELNVASLPPASLDAAIGDDDTSRLIEIVEDERAVMPSADLEDKNNLQLVASLIQTLEPREATILRMRFGLDGAAERTLEEIGKKFGLTRERIRQLQNEALRKLRRGFEDLDVNQQDTVEVAA